eukprot:403376251
MISPHQNHENQSRAHPQSVGTTNKHPDIYQLNKQSLVISNSQMHLKHNAIILQNSEPKKKNNSNIQHLISESQSVKNLSVAFQEVKDYKSSLISQFTVNSNKQYNEQMGEQNMLNTNMNSPVNQQKYPQNFNSAIKQTKNRNSHLNIQEDLMDSPPQRLKNQGAQYQGNFKDTKTNSQQNQLIQQKGNSAGKSKRDMSVDALDYRKQLYGVSSSDHQKDKNERKLINLIALNNNASKIMSLPSHHQNEQNQRGIQSEEINHQIHNKSSAQREDLMSRETAHFRLTFSQNQWEELEEQINNHKKKKRSGSNPSKHNKHVNIFASNDAQNKSLNNSRDLSNNLQDCQKLQSVKSQQSLSSIFKNHIPKKSESNHLNSKNHSRQNSSRGSNTQAQNESSSNLPLINQKHLSLDNQQHQHYNSQPLDQLQSAVTKINNMIPSIVGGQDTNKQLKKKAHFLKRIKVDSNSNLQQNPIVKDYGQQQTRNKYVNSLHQQMSESSLPSFNDQYSRSEQITAKQNPKQFQAQVEMSIDQSELFGGHEILKTYSSQQNMLNHYTHLIEQSTQQQHYQLLQQQHQQTQKHPSRLPSLEKKQFESSTSISQQQINSNHQIMTKMPTLSLSNVKNKLIKLKEKDQQSSKHSLIKPKQLQFGLYTEEDEQQSDNMIHYQSQQAMLSKYESNLNSHANNSLSGSHQFQLQSVEGSFKQSPRRLYTEDNANINMMRSSSSSILSNQLGNRLKQITALSPKANEKIVQRYFPKDFFGTHQPQKFSKIKLNVNSQFQPSQ